MFIGTWKYRKPEASTIRGTCVLCKKYPQKQKSGGKYKPLCSTCDKKVYGDYLEHTRRVLERKSSYRVHKKDYCEKCNFVPEDKCQLDVDHIDGDHDNNDITNLQTLCANCHRLKTKTNKDWSR